MATAFDHEESLTHAEVQLRFKKIIGREMTPEEMKEFLLPPEVQTNPSPDKA
jgi:hypothetical protein